MKYLAWFGGVIILLLAVLYVIAFTPLGNSILKPIVEKNINKELKLDSKFSKFSLTMNDFEILLEIDSKNSLHVKGYYSIFSQSFDVAYRVKLDSLESLKQLTQAPLRGAIATEGTVKGNRAFIEIDGFSDVAKSDTTYHVELKDFNPTSVIAKVKEADLASLLYIGGEEAYANAGVNLDVNLKSITIGALDGDLLLTTKNAEIDTKLMKKEFDLTIPKTDFRMNLSAKLKSHSVDYDYMLTSNLAKITSSGGVNISSLMTDIAYSLDIKELALFKPITNLPLRGAFFTDGSVMGDKKSMLVNGKSDIGGSKTTYKIDLNDFKPKSVLANIKGAKVEKLLYMLGEPNYASSDLDVDVKLTSLDPKNLAGEMSLVMSNGLINSKVMKKIYNVDIPRTTFKSNQDVSLNGKDIIFNSIFNSSLATMNSKGTIVPDTMDMDLVYNLNIKELALLKPITGADIRGKLKLDGKVKGNKEKLVVDGSSDFASSKTTFVATLKDFTPSTLKASMKDLKLASVLYMVKQPHYADGIFSLDVDISDARTDSLKGVVVSNVKKGLVDSSYMSKAYEFNTKMPRTTFNSSTHTTLDGNIANTKVDFNSNLANFDIKKASFNIENGSLKSDYAVNIANLDKLFFVTQRHLKGGLKANGELKKDKDLDLSVHSKVAGGKIDAKLHNDDFHADLKSLQTLDMLKILIYPEIFKSSLNGRLDYNLAKERGTFKADLIDGVFTKNSMLDLVKKYAKMDLYKENFKGEVRADINKENILSSMDLTSRNSSIKTKDAKLNSKTKKIKAKVLVVANKHPLELELKGDVASPSVSVDVEELLKSKTGDAIKKEVNKLFKKFF